jgi:hypothetical protein
MADARITDLADGGAILASDQFVIARAGANYKIAGAAILGALKVFDSTLGADTASIDTGAGGIPAGYSAIEIMLMLRTDEAAAISNANLRLNNDSGANYDTEDDSANGSTAAAAHSAGLTSILAIVHGAGGSASYPGMASVVIPAYDQTTFFKTGLLTETAHDATLGNNWTVVKGFTWKSTSAITRVAVSAAGTAKLKAGSRMLIYLRP